MRSSSSTTRPAPVLLALSLLLLPTAASAQSSSRWGLEAGGGAGVLASGHDGSKSGQWSPAARIGVERAVGRVLGARAALTLEWVGVWPASRLAGGRESRHHLGIGAALRPDGSGLVVGATLGPGLATVVEADVPPDDSPVPGDGVVTVGDTSGLGMVVEAGWRIEGNGLRLVPRLGLLAQRVQGRLLSHGLLTLSVGPGR